ncbi:MAG: TonB-dependent receptor [Rhizomicrobium sp.]
MRLMKALLIGACPLVLSAMPALAQSTGSQELETVIVSGTRVNLSGLSSSTPVSKQMSTITQDFIATQTPGQTVFQSLNMLPGFTFTNNDPYGTSGGNIRMHGQSGNHISLTLDGLPLNDTGNYAVYTNQMIDPEVTGRVSINQGTTDVDSPTAAVTGGSIGIQSVRPDEAFGVMGEASFGTYDYQRYFAKLDTGSFGPYNTRAYLTGSYSDYDKFKGPGQLRKSQLNFDVYQDMGSIGWVNFAMHYNRNRNNSYYSPYYYGGGVNKDDWKDSGDYQSSCTAASVTTGKIDAADSCTNWYKLRINPSDTANARLSSLWHLTKDLTLTVDGNVQYTLANGGGSTAINEHSGQMVGSTGTYSKTASTATVTPFGCISGANGGCDLNGDGDILDTVRVYSPSNTNTRRWGFNTSLIYAIADGQTLRMAYTLDYGVHRQTGQYSRIGTSGPYSVFGGWDDADHQVVAADGTDIRKRDRTSHAILNQASFDYEGNWLDDMVQLSLGARMPFFERQLDQNCYTQIKTSNVLCTTETPSAKADDGTVTFTSVGTSTKYIAPQYGALSYNRFLPHLGATFMPLGKEHQFFIAYTQEMAAPQTDSLYASTGSIDSATSSVASYSAVNKSKPETSTSYTIGYRYIGEDLKGSVTLWNTQAKNRLISSYDQDAGVSTYHSVPGVNYAGVDFDLGYSLTNDLWVYGSGSYTSARILSDITVGTATTGGKTSVLYAYTGGKQIAEVPNWTFAGRLQYSPFAGAKFGFEGQYVGRRFATDDNVNSHVPGYFVANLDTSYDLDSIGFTGSSIRLNVDNLFNRHYYGSISTQSCYNAAKSGCTSAPYLNPSALRTISVTLIAKY